ncbi:MAG: energy-coupling factor transporter ATPase [Deltaproteobacteria bacterium]|nr:energy-coupling factor transporter ATPase [Deltaproteobacteria bacterium]
MEAGRGWAIETEALSFLYPEGTRALQDVDFRVRRGEFVAVLASNGSGKTTLIKVLSGLLRPGTGTVRIAGRDIRGFPSRDLYQEVGVVFQDPNDQLFGATVEEDVAFGPRNLGLPEPEVGRRVAAALESVVAGDLLSRAVHHLSFGEKKRVAVAGVLAMEPSILILDEATAGLDPAGETLMMRLLSRLNRERGITVILATHSVDLLPLFADRIYVFRGGRVLKDGPPEAIFCEHEMIERASLRLPYISGLLHDLKRYDGVPIEGLPLTVGEARKRLLDLIPEALIVGNREGGGK